KGVNIEMTQRDDARHSRRQHAENHQQPVAERKVDDAIEKIHTGSGSFPLLVASAACTETAAEGLGQKDAAPFGGDDFSRQDTRQELYVLVVTCADSHLSDVEELRRVFVERVL